MRQASLFRCMCVKWLSLCLASVSLGQRDPHAASGEHIRARTGETGRQVMILSMRWRDGFGSFQLDVG